MVRDFALRCRVKTWYDGTPFSGLLGGGAASQPDYSSKVEATATIEPGCAVCGSVVQLARIAQHGGSDVEAPVNALVLRYLSVHTKFVSHSQIPPRVSCIVVLFVWLVPATAQRTPT